MTKYETFQGAKRRRLQGWIYRWTVTSSLITVVLVGGMVFLWYARSQSQRVECGANLFGLIYGMRVYQDKYGHLPAAYVEAPDGKRMHSWRILITEDHSMPSSVQYEFNEPWNSPRNTRFADYRPRRYACPSDSASRKNQRLTNYFVVTGKGTPFPGSGTTRLPVLASPQGSSNTILIVEANNLNIEWLEPRDLTFDGMSHVPDDSKWPSVSSHHSDGPLVMMADGSVRSVKGIAPEVLRVMLQYHPVTEDD